MRMLIGTYNEGNNNPGVYLYEFNEADASFRCLDTAASGNPSMVIPAAEGMAYAVGEYEDGRQCAYAYRLTDGQIDIVGRQSTAGEKSDGSGPCNIVVAGGCVITSNYGGGSLSAFTILSNGSLGPLCDQFVPNDHRTARLHQAIISPCGKYLFANDLGHDCIYRFTIREGAPLSDPDSAYQFSREQHPGPRHMTFSRDGKFAYLIHEKGDLLTTFSYVQGQLTHLQTQLAYDGEGHGSADIHIHPNGRYLYTSHRLTDDGITIWQLDPVSGLPERIGYQPTGIHPRNFAITPQGNYLLCACRDSNRIEIYRIRKDGLLQCTGRTIGMPAPVSIRFI